MIEIVDENGSKKLAKSLRVVEHKIYDQINDQYITEKYVEAHIIGKQFEWVEYYPLDKFRKLNPGVKI
ncbi:hypothetical protein DRO19_05505 [Candidatus Bathyarchaeota archaeon]|nr:MAG: hypothetical protein DRO19_05505 [Candidatus Bathyarchaeota archaeon]